MTPSRTEGANRCKADNIRRRTVRYALTLTVAIAILVAFAPRQVAADLISFKTFSIKNETGKVADDFHISIGTGKIVKFRLDQGDFQFDPNTLPANELNLTNSVVGAGGSVGFTIGFEGFDGKDFKANWTQSGTNTGNVLTSSQAGVFLDGSSGGGSFAFGNPFLSAAALLTNVAFASVPDFDMFTQDPNTLVFGPATSFTLDPGEQQIISLGDVVPGNVIVTKGTVAFGDAAPYQFFATHSVVPEPSSVAFVGIGSVVILAYIFRRGRRSSTFSS